MAVSILAVLSVGLITFCRNSIQAAENESEEAFYLEEADSGIAAFSFDNSAKLPVSSVRFDKFESVDDDTNTPE